MIIAWLAYQIGTTATFENVVSGNINAVFSSSLLLDYWSSILFADMKTDMKFDNRQGNIMERCLLLTLHSEKYCSLYCLMQRLDLILFVRWMHLLSAKGYLLGNWTNLEKQMS